MKVIQWVIIFCIIMLVGCTAPQQSAVYTGNPSEIEVAEPLPTNDQHGVESTEKPVEEPEQSTSPDEDPEELDAPDTFDLTQGVVCDVAQTPGTGYFFKGNKMRYDLAPDTYDIQIGNDDYYKISEDGCDKIKASKTMLQQRDDVIEESLKVQLERSPPYPRGTPICAQSQVSDVNFELPRSCED